MDDDEGAAAAALFDVDDVDEHKEEDKDVGRRVGFLGTAIEALDPADTLAVAAALAEFNVIDERDAAAISAVLEEDELDARQRRREERTERAWEKEKERETQRERAWARGEQGNWRRCESGSGSASASGTFGAGKGTGSSYISSAFCCCVIKRMVLWDCPSQPSAMACSCLFLL